MKKSFGIIMILLFACVFFTGCGCKHEWKKATCTEPKTCKLCGETEGKPLGHKWVDATCTEPKTCAVCGETEGKPLGHKKVDATCTEPMTCAVCGETKGEPLGHDWVGATLTEPKTCARCGKTEGKPISFEFVDVSFLDGASYSYVLNEDLCVAENEDPKNYYTYYVCNLKGDVFAGVSVDTSRKGGNNGHCFHVSDQCMLLALGLNNETDVCIYDYDGNLILEKVLTRNEADVYNGARLGMNDRGINGLYEVYNQETGDKLFYFDLEKKSECAAGEYETACKKEGIVEDFDESKWCCYQYDPVIDGYLVGTADESEWGYYDRNGNEIAMYKDATAFCELGYALVTDDGRSYDLIDTDLNVVGEDVAEGIGAVYRYGNLFSIMKSEKKEEYAVVK